jgi:Fic-DOC domain mobile mystery protein B
VIDRLLERGDGHTELDPDDRVGLKPSWVRTRGDLNAAEQDNIAKALASLRQPAPETVLDDLWLRQLHSRMFGDVWDWAGKYRTRNMNLGIEFALIPTSVRNLVSDAARWMQSKDEPVVLGARFHHGLVSIHPFPNGNGRHGRAAAGLLVKALGAPDLTWGRGYNDPDQARAAYLAALRAADRGNHDPLNAFVVS